MNTNITATAESITTVIIAGVAKLPVATTPLLAVPFVLLLLFALSFVATSLVADEMLPLGFSGFAGVSSVLTGLIDGLGLDADFAV